MCMTKLELENTVQEIRKYRSIAEEAEEIRKALEFKVIAYMQENGIDTEITDTAKITYKTQSRATLDKNLLEHDFGCLAAYTKITEYSVLRIK